MSPRFWLLLTFGILLVFASFGVAYAGTEQDKMYREMFANTAQLNENCSATAISSTRDNATGKVTTIFLTAKHCVVDKQKSDMVLDLPVYKDNRLVRKTRYIARVKGVYFGGDLALLELKDQDTFFETVSKLAPETAPLAMGDDVWTVGYPLAMSLTVSKGLFGAIETNDFDVPGTEYYRATPDIAGGNSGGAMYRQNAAGDYELIGVTAARARSDSFIGLYTPLPVIRAYLKIALPDLVK